MVSRAIIWLCCCYKCVLVQNKLVNYFIFRLCHCFLCRICCSPFSRGWLLYLLFVVGLSLFLSLLSLSRRCHEGRVHFISILIIWTLPYEVSKIRCGSVTSQVPQPSCCWKHSWYLSQPSQSAVVYFLAMRMQNFCPFWPVLAILSQIYALFRVIFTGPKKALESKNWQISGIAGSNVFQVRLLPCLFSDRSLSVLSQKLNS